MQNKSTDRGRFKKQIDSIRDRLDQLSREPNDAARLVKARRLMLELNRAELLSQASKRASGRQDRDRGPAALEE